MDTLHHLTTLFKTLSDESRLRIINLLMNMKELCVCDIERTLGFTQTKVSRHLTYLKRAGLVRDRRVGTWILYSLTVTDNLAHNELLTTLNNVLQLYPALQEDISQLQLTIKKGECATLQTIYPSVIHLRQSQQLP